MFFDSAQGYCWGGDGNCVEQSSSCLCVCNIKISFFWYSWICHLVLKSHRGLWAWQWRRLRCRRRCSVLYASFKAELGALISNIRTWAQMSLLQGVEATWEGDLSSLAQADSHHAPTLNRMMRTRIRPHRMYQKASWLCTLGRRDKGLLSMPTIWSTRCSRPCWRSLLRSMALDTKEDCLSLARWRTSNISYGLFRRRIPVFGGRMWTHVRAFRPTHTRGRVLPFSHPCLMSFGCQLTTVVLMDSHSSSIWCPARVYKWRLACLTTL